ncbi:hypothetical protein Syun_017428 [Stephania yunnanensis]|uniref:Uncharacterized protein n=1 Tax=Stephania yunnanensis TaxID=152371 RepID=A0AAP0J6X4_9MAGN
MRHGIDTMTIERAHISEPGLRRLHITEKTKRVAQALQSTPVAHSLFGPMKIYW